MNEEKIFLMLEQMQSEQRKFHEQTGKNFASIDKRLETVDKRLDAVDKHLEVIDNRLDAIEADISVIKEDVHELRRLSDGAFEDIHRLDRRTAQFSKPMPSAL